MFLDYIEITNFRPFYGTQKINFGFNDEENLTVILADNGSGKTSLVNALTWCLYGSELHDVRNKSEPLYNLKAAKEAEESDDSDLKVDVIVKIRFYYYDEDSSKKYFVVSRKLTYQNWGSVKWESGFDSYLVVDETGKKLLEDDFAQDKINNIIPEDMFEYFFFNGATLSNYFKNESELNLKKSVEKISQIGLINKVSDHLSKTLNSLNKKYDNKKPEGHKNYNNLIQDKVDKKAEIQEQINSNYATIDEAHENVLKYKKLLDKVDSEYINKLTKQRDELETHKTELENNIKKNTNEYEKLILELFPIAVLFDDLVESLEIIDDAKEKKTAPPPIERDLLKDILEDGYCICGTKLDEHPECVEELTKRLKNTSKVRQETFYEDYYDIKKVINRLKDLPKIEELKFSVDNDCVNLSNLKNRIEKISDEVVSYDLEEVQLYEQHYQKNFKKMKELRRTNISLSPKIDKLDKEIKELKCKREEEVEVKEELKILEEKIIFSENAMDIVADLNSNVQEHIREKINNKTREQFTGIGWAYNKYNDVKIEEDYQIWVIKSTGQKVRPGDLSDGEENLLALSFMMALHSLSGFEIPLIIDAPLEKLDKTKRIEFIKGLHDYTFDKQIVFLFTDSQYTNDVRAQMLEHTVDEYVLKPSENHTEIVKHDK